MNSDATLQHVLACLFLTLLFYLTCTQKESFDTKEIVNISVKIIEALIFLHETAKIVHCALSPHSILFAKRSKKHGYFEVKIANFEYAIDMTCDFLGFHFLTYYEK